VYGNEWWDEYYYAILKEDLNNKIISLLKNLDIFRNRAHFCFKKCAFFYETDQIIYMGCGSKVNII
jgi:hypothetical protein